MKILAAFVLTGAVLVVASPALAGRDESQRIQLRQAMEKNKAENLARAQQEQAGLAGTTGAPGKIGPGTQRPRAGRIDPTAHP